MKKKKGKRRKESGDGKQVTGELFSPLERGRGV
jgi:hypothetical protein